MKTIAMLALLLCACGSPQPGPPAEQTTETAGKRVPDAAPEGPPAATPAAGPEAPTRWTSEEVTVERSGPPVAISVITVTRETGYDRITIAFGGDSLPGYRISYIKKPVQNCASGMDVAVTGSAWLEIRLASAAAHDSAGVAMGPPRVPPSANALRGLHKTCDFEGVVTFVADLLSPNGFAVVERRNPAAIEVDVRK